MTHSSASRMMSTRGMRHGEWGRSRLALWGMQPATCMLCSCCEGTDSRLWCFAQLVQSCPHGEVWNDAKDISPEVLLRGVGATDK